MSDLLQKSQKWNSKAGLLEEGDFIIQDFGQNCKQSLEVLENIFRPQVISQIGIKPNVNALNDMVLIVKMIMDMVNKCVDN